MKFHIKSFAIVIAALFMNSTASAYSITVGGTAITDEGLTTSVADATVVDFNSGSMPANYSGGAVVIGDSASNWASPPDDNTYYYSVGPRTEGRRVRPRQSSPGTITFGSLNAYFGFYGGSPDDYNSIELWRDDTQIAVFSGTYLSNIAGLDDNGNQSQGAYWNIWAENASEYFNIVKFVSTQNAFETDNHAYLAADAVSAVPIPASAWLFVSGVIGLISFTKRNRTS